MTETLVVVSFLIEKDCKVLLVQEAEDEIREQWCFPGGKLEQGETIQKGAEREMLEECGMSLTSVSIIRVYEGVRDNKLGVRIHLKATGGPVEGSVLSEDIIYTSWFTKEELRKLHMSGKTRKGVYHQREISDYLNDIPANGVIVTLES